MRAPGVPSIYGFGYRHRLLSIQAQQIRALNLVWALKTRGELPSSLLVIGAGVAGLTLAVGAATQGVRVQVLDHALAPMGNLRHALHRYVHPNMLRWPHPDWDAPSAVVPIMGWQASYADKLWHHFIESFERYRSLLDAPPELHLAVQKLVARRDGAAWLAEWFCGRTYTRSFEAIALATGPGHEDSTYASTRYWDQDERALDLRAHCHRELVSGAGDGGLIDVIRKVLYDRDYHERISHLALLGIWSDNVANGQSPLGNQLENFRNKHRSLEHALLNTERFSLPDAPVEIVIRNACPVSLFPDGAACDVHRAIAYILFKAEKIRRHESTDLPILTRNEERRAWFGEDATRPYHRVTVRHGTAKDDTVLDAMDAGQQAPAEWRDNFRAHLETYRELHQPAELYGADSGIFQPFRDSKSRRVKGDWPHQAGDLWLKLEGHRTAFGATSAHLSPEYLRVATSPDRIGWLHARLGRPEAARDADLTSVADILDYAVRALPAMAIEQQMKNAPAVTWMADAAREGSLCSADRGVLLPPAPGRKDPTLLTRDRLRLDPQRTIELSYNFDWSWVTSMKTVRFKERTLENGARLALAPRVSIDILPRRQIEVHASRDEKMIIRADHLAIIDFWLLCHRSSFSTEDCWLGTGWAQRHVAGIRVAVANIRTAHEKKKTIFDLLGAHVLVDLSARRPRITPSTSRKVHFSDIT